MLYVIVLLLVSVSALLPHLSFKNPDIKKIADKIRPHYHLIGLCGFIAGIIFVVQAVFAIGLMKDFGYAWLLWIALAVDTVLLGFLAGFPKILLHIAKEGKKKTEGIYGKFAPYERILAYAGLVICLLLFIHIATAKPDIFTALLIKKLGGE